MTTIFGSYYPGKSVYQDCIYQTHFAEEGCHILVYRFNGVTYVFIRKIFVPVEEFRK